VIEPRQDAYGAEADTTHLADYLELLALAHHPLKRADLADFLGDLGWPVRSRELYHQAVPGPDAEPSQDELDGGPGVSPAAEAADRVFQLILDRSALLGDLYPFEFQEPQVVRHRRPDQRHDAYLCLLAITVAHHYSVNTPTSPERVFESVVAQAMTARGLATVDMGAAGRGTGDFRDAVRAAATALALVPAPDAAPSRRHANEEGVDTVSHLTWGDTRGGHWIFIGQATCGQSGTWQTKIQQPLPGQWGPMLTSLVPPIAYLAVPHHVETQQMLHLSTGTRRLVLDRLRLCRHLGAVTADQRDVLDAVVGEGAYHPLAA
jgi:hypothetical protein